MNKYKLNKRSTEGAGQNNSQLVDFTSVECSPLLAHLIFAEGNEGKTVIYEYNIFLLRIG